MRKVLAERVEFTVKTERGVYVLRGCWAIPFAIAFFALTWVAYLTGSPYLTWERRGK